MPSLQSHDRHDQMREFYEDGSASSQVADRDDYPKSKSGPLNSKGIGSFLIGLVISALFGLGLGYLYFLYEQNQPTIEQANNSAETNSSQSPNSTTDNSSESSDLTALKPPPVQTTATPVPAPETLNLQVSHPNGTVLQLIGVTFAEDSTTVELQVANNSRNLIKLNDNQDMVLKDNLGNQYKLVPAPENPELVVQPGTTLNGQFVFLGQVPTSATRLTLVTNDQSGSSQDNTVNPKLIIADIPA